MTAASAVTPTAKSARAHPTRQYALGAKNLVIGSAEYEHYFNGGPWGAAVFVDTGSAFDNTIDLHTGVGFGVRWNRRWARCAWISRMA